MEKKRIQKAIYFLMFFLFLVTFLGRLGGFKANNAPLRVEESVFCKGAHSNRESSAKRLMCKVGLDVNKDSAWDLEWLPGVGPGRAQSIVDSRRRNGPFNSATDLTRVRGIGSKTVKQIEPWLEW